MSARNRIAAAAGGVAAAATLLAALVSGGSVAPAELAERVEHPLGVRVGCDSQSAAGFPGAYSSRRNLVVGPLALIGAAAFTDEATVLEHGGNKSPLLVRAGHTVTVSVPERHRATASLDYGFQALGRHTITFSACSARLSQSRADGPVTFWSGFVRTTVPSCVPLDVWVDRESRRRVRVPLGRRCPARAAAAPPPLRGCATRAESGGPDDGGRRPGEVAIGPLRFAGLARLARRRALAVDRTGVYRARQGRRELPVYRVKVGVVLPAGVRATLSIGATARGRAALSYAPRPPGVRTRPVGEPAVRFEACAADEPAFSYDGPVGPVTGFSGGFVLTRPGCVPLEVAVPGRAMLRARVPFGVGRCP